MERNIIVGKIYRHISGNYYRVICLAKSSEGKNQEEPEEMVVYESLGNDRTIWVRSLEHFQEKVDKKKNPDCVQEYRFEQVDDQVYFR